MQTPAISESELWSTTKKKTFCRLAYAGLGREFALTRALRYLDTVELMVLRLVVECTECTARIGATLRSRRQAPFFFSIDLLTPEYIGAEAEAQTINIGKPEGLATNRGF